jgi:hypothetical protein
METRVKRCWPLEGLDRGEVFEAGGFLLQRGHRSFGQARQVYVVGRRAGRAGIFIGRDSAKGYPIEFSGGPRVDPPDDIRETIELCAEIRRCAGIVAKVPLIGKYARDNRVHTFIDFTPIPDEEEEGVRAAIVESLGISPSDILGFDK